MNKKFIKLCLASILSLSLNTNLQAQELERPTVQKHRVTETDRITRGIQEFLYIARKTYRNAEINFSENDMKIEISNSKKFYDRTIAEDLGEVYLPCKCVNGILSIMKQQPWLGVLKSFELNCSPSRICELVKVLSQMPNLNNLQLMVSGIESKFFELAPAIARMHNLQTLKIFWSSINDSIMTSFVKSLQETEGFNGFLNLKNLDLACNYLAQNNPETLVSFLSFTPNLQELDLSGNHIGKNLTKLAPSISKMPNLEKLNLSSDNLETMSPDEWNILMTALKCTPNLRILDLRYNKIDGLTVNAFIDTLIQTDSIAGISNLICHQDVVPTRTLEIDFRNNGISAEERAALQFAMTSYNPVIQLKF